MTRKLRFPRSSAPFPDERVLVRWNAWRTQNSRRFCRGWLYLTTHRLIFQPRPWSAFFDGEFWQFGLAGIAGVRRHPRDTSQLLGGSFRDQMLIERSDGTQDPYVVRHLDDVIDQIRVAIKETWL